jgi:hypothetical protein
VIKIEVEKVKIVEVRRVGTTILVTFSDGRVTTLETDEMYGNSHQPLLPTS